MEQRLLHTDGECSPPRPAGYWTELLHGHRAHLVLHLVETQFMNMLTCLTERDVSKRGPSMNSLLLFIKAL